jgi:hypothetical protein
VARQFGPVTAGCISAKIEQKWRPAQPMSKTSRESSICVGMVRFGCARIDLRPATICLMSTTSGAALSDVGAEKNALPAVTTFRTETL